MTDHSTSYEAQEPLLSLYMVRQEVVGLAQENDTLRNVSGQKPDNNDNRCAQSSVKLMQPV